MGLPMEMTILRPTPWSLFDENRDQKRGEGIVWKPVAIMNGYASWPSDDSRMPTGHGLATICMVSWIYGKVLEVAKKPGRRIFAPLFAIPEDMTGGPVYLPLDGWLYKYSTICPVGQQVVLPWWYGEYERATPVAGDRRMHNSIVGLSKYKFGQWLQKANYKGGIFELPLIWERCSNVGRWLRELEENGNHVAQKALKRDPEALRVVRARRAYLAELGKIGYRILFTYERGINSERFL